MKEYRLKEIANKIINEYDRGARDAAGLLFCILAGMLFVGFRLASPLFLGFDFDLALSRLYYGIRGERTAPSDIVLVGIDDLSYYKFRKYQEENPEIYSEYTFARKDPFPRGVVADGLSIIQRAKPKLVIQDLYIESKELGTDADERLVEALSQGPTVISKLYTNATNEKGRIVPTDESAVVRSEKIFRDAASMEMLVMLDQSGGEGAVSRIVLQDNVDLPMNERIPLLGPLTELAQVEPHIPRKWDRINFYGPPGHIDFISFYELFSFSEQKSVKDKLKDKIVFFGYQSILQGRGHDDKDQFEVPYSSDEMFGVEIHATIAGNLIDGSFFRRYAGNKEMLGLFLLVTLLLWYMNQLRNQAWIIAVPFIFSALWFAGGYIAFSRYNFFIPGALSSFVFSIVLIIFKVLTNYSHLMGSRKEVERITG